MKNDQWGQAIDSKDRFLLLRWFRNNPDVQWRPGGFTPADPRSQVLQEMFEQLLRDEHLRVQNNSDGSISYIVVEDHLPIPQRGLR